MTTTKAPRGPLAGLRVVEIAAQGPGPFAAMMLADLGADVVRVDRPSASGGPGQAAVDVVGRGRRSIVLDLKDPRGVDVLLRLADTRDILIEGFRPGVAERLGFGPEVCLRRRPTLVYGRATGWGQRGPKASLAGHDANYIATTGALHAIGVEAGPPVLPLNLVGDYGGGGMLLALGVMCALWAASRSGRGQVVDAAMVDGSALLMAQMYSMLATGSWSVTRGVNILDSGAHFYNVYQTADGEHVAVAAIEAPFYRRLLDALGLDPADLPAQHDQSQWPRMKALFAERFAEHTRDHWCALLEDTDACFAPVLSMAEAPQYPHHRDRDTFIKVDGVVQPAPAPRFSHTPTAFPEPAPTPGLHTADILTELGLDAGAADELRRDGVVA
ncbi:CaiB/BaiF CoA transferase family protein [Acrocarpospora catenulata]|uniref:CaiB/BaiF CoA transferase family protein n=1 Tax=Acrocarpospora catenulata TaxID=2836182 RepID=UPI001BDA9F60|nr:CaiB/BaiF CoA-transferase family protein [Acrocarpospora catenulata]